MKSAVRQDSIILGTVDASESSDQLVVKYIYRQESELSKTSSTDADPPRIAVVGSLNSDIFIGVERLPQVGETIGANRVQKAFGGKVNNSDHHFPSHLYSRHLLCLQN